MLTFNKIWHGSIFSLSALLIATSFGIQYSQDNRVVAQAGSCGPDAFILTPNNGDTVGGVVPIAVHVDPLINGTAANADKVKITANTQFIGEADPDGNIWDLEWDTQVGPFPNGLAQLRAQIFSSGNVICTTDLVDVDVQNSSGSNVTGDFFLLRKEPPVQQWVGPTQIPKNFKVEARFKPVGQTTSGNVTSDTIFDWRLSPESVGYLDPIRDENDVDYFTGPDPGTATLIVEAQFSGYTDTRTFNITVEPQSSTNYPELDEDEVDDFIDETEDEAPENEPPFDQITSAELNEVLTSDPDLTNCLSGVVGDDGYQAIVDGERRLTFSELREAERCFVSTRFLLPANVAPVDPARIREVRENTRAAKIADVESAEERGLDREGIVFSGEATPNSSVVLYIFSEPLVLTTSTDENGNWTYVLEDPLEPGEHEVFVAVEDNEGEVVRSSAFTFNVAQAASIESNQSGLSLTLDLSDPEQNSMIYYVSAVAATMLVGVGLYIFVIRRKTNIVEPAEDSEVSSEKES